MTDRRVEEPRKAGPDAALVIATHDKFVAGRMKTQWTIDHGVLR